MAGAVGFHGDSQFHRRLPVDADELVVLQLDDIAVLVGDGGCDLDQFSCLVRKQYGDGEDTILLDQSVLYHGGHGDHVHVAAAENQDGFFALQIQLVQGCHRQKSGVFYDHLVVFHHIEERPDETGIVHCEHLCDVFFAVREDLRADPFYGRSVCDGVGRWQCDRSVVFQCLRHAGGRS